MDDERITYLLLFLGVIVGAFLGTVSGTLLVGFIIKSFLW